MQETNTSSSVSVAVVTGAASGIGRATARRLAKAGHAVVAADVDAEGLEQLEAELPGLRCEMLDVTDAAAIESFADRIDAEMEGVDILVNSAGILQDNVPPDEMAIAEHDRIWAVNYRGTFLCCRAFGRPMTRRGAGAIINIASVTALRPLPLFAYGPGKAAVVSLTQTLAGHYGPFGVRVNAVAPGYVLTPALEQRIRDGLRDPAMLTEPSALGRMVRPEEIAAAIAFLVGPDAEAITGVTLPVDAGWLAGSAWGTYGGLPHAAATKP